MTIAPGTRLGPYEIVSPIAAGGMGEVFKARDTRLDRSVAIKILPAEFAENAQRKIRFEREAKTISQLNHPHICTLYDVGENYLVMELLEGESLADRLARGALPLDQVLRYGIDIAEALDKAHKAGVVHRDLKPGNVMITKSGAKLLDFGLAKTNSVISSQSSVLETQHKPLTQQGALLGTFQYMAPEQLEGAEADARTDIFALGVVLYEMLTGKRAFDGKTKTSLIAAIVSTEPKPLREFQPLTPPAFEHVVAKCLAKDPEDRWQSAHDVAEELKWISSTNVVPTSTHRGRRKILALLALLVTVAAATIAWVAASQSTRRQERAAVYRLTIATPPGSVLGYAAGSMELSPDGRLITYASSSSDRSLLVRSLSDTTWRTIDGTTGASGPFWSPDSKQIAYFARGSVWKVAADGSGAPEEIARVNQVWESAGTWSRDGVIVLGTQGELYRVNASGGNAVLLRGFDRQTLVGTPDFLPDGRHVVCSVFSMEADQVTYFVAAIDGSEAPKRIGAGENNAKYQNGYLFFVRSGTLHAQPFDTRRLALTGEPRAITKVQGFQGEAARFSVAGDTLVYLPQGSEVRTELARVDRAGKTVATLGAPQFFFSPRISRDGSRIAVDESTTTGPGDIWIFDVPSGASTRFTFASADESAPVWGPGDTELMYYLSQPGKLVVMRKRIAGGQASLALQVKGDARTGDWSPDGMEFLALTSDSPLSPEHITAFDVRTWKPLGAPIAGLGPRFSPDGRWFVYASDENGRGSEVFVQPFPPNGSKWQVSVNGGTMPVWRRDGKALFFVNGDGKLSESLVNADRNGTFSSQAPQALFRVALREAVGRWAQYDVFPDGTFLLNRIPDNATTPMTVLIHWKEALAR